MIKDETELLVQTDNGPRPGIDPDDQPSQDPDWVPGEEEDLDPDWTPGPEDLVDDE